MTQEERIKEYMRMMHEATERTGITYAVEAGKPLIVFDVRSNEPIPLDITVGTDVRIENGRASVTTFDKSNIASKEE